MNTITTHARSTVKLALPLLTIGLIAGCSTQSGASSAQSGTSSALSTSSSAPSASSYEPSVISPVQSVTSLASTGYAPASDPVDLPAPAAPVAPAQPAPPPAPALPSQCTDSDLLVVNGNMQSFGNVRSVVVSFKNISTHPCTLGGYPGADLVANGGLLIHIPRRPANAAHQLTLVPGGVATADIQASATDTAGYGCHWGTLVVTPPNDFHSHTLNAGLPVCNASISSVD